eukprot:364774-Chlamydomonas_euryale.AAC.11
MMTGSGWKSMEIAPLACSAQAMQSAARSDLPEQEAHKACSAEPPPSLCFRFNAPEAGKGLQSALQVRPAIAELL